MAVYLGNKKVSVKGGYIKDGGGDTSYPLSKFIAAEGKFANTTYTYTELTNIIKPSDTSKQQDFTYMFSGCTNLTTIPLIDTSNATSMLSMFSDCTNLTTIPQLNTTKVYDMSHMFSGCTNLTTIPLMDTSKVTNMTNMFSGCTNLKVVPALVCPIINNRGTVLTNMFQGCYNVEEIHMTGMTRTFNIQDCTKLTREALVEILNNLGTPQRKTSLYLGSENLAKLTEEDKAIATSKNWRL